MGQIKAIITDFDGTLVDTFEANYCAYKESFEKYGYELTEEQYKECFGLRFDGLCEKLNIKNEHKQLIKDLKKEVYPKYFDKLKLNTYLMMIINAAKNMHIKICIASTASKENLYNALGHFNIEKYFDLIITGEDVKNGKPDPEVYNEALIKLNINSDEAIVFEDSIVGCLAAKNAGINYINISNK